MGAIKNDNILVPKKKDKWRKKWIQRVGIYFTLKKIPR